MAAGLVDTTVLYAAANRSAQRHETATAIVRGVDHGALPQVVVPDPMLIETMNGVARDVGHGTAVDFLDRLRLGSQFELRREPTAVWRTGIELFETIDRLSLADGLLVAAARHHGIEHCYSFDDDFDGIDGIVRLSTATDPFSPTES